MPIGAQPFVVLFNDDDDNNDDDTFEKQKI
jgi:hypothetical protein